MTRSITLASLCIFSACVPVDDPWGGGQSGEEAVTCSDVESVPLGDDEVSELGFGKAEIAALAEGEHARTLVYADGSSAALTMTVALGDARWLDMEYVSDGSGIEPAMECANQVEVDATITFVTDDGAFMETWETSLLASQSDSASFSVSLDLDALGGDFVYTPDADYDEIQAWVEGTFDSTGAWGEIVGYGIKSEGSGDDGVTSATRLSMATW